MRQTNSRNRTRRLRKRRRTREVAAPVPHIGRNIIFISFRCCLSAGGVGQCSQKRVLWDALLIPWHMQSGLLPFRFFFSIFWAISISGPCPLLLRFLIWFLLLISVRTEISFALFHYFIFISTFGWDLMAFIPHLISAVCVYTLHGLLCRNALFRRALSPLWTLCTLTYFSTETHVKTDGQCLSLLSTNGMSVYVLTDMDIRDLK